MREDQRNRVPRIEQSGECALCEFWGTREDEAQEGTRRPRTSASGALAQLFGELCAHPLLLELREVFDEHLAFEVIHFVLDANRQ